MRPYAPGPISVWSDHDISFGARGHPLFHQSLSFTGPLVSADAPYVLAGDVRLDDRRSLCDALELPGECSRGDSELFLACWERWGEDTLDRIVGDFAVAIWDRLEKQLILARDALGQRPLYFSAGKGCVAFASMPSGLHTLADIPRSVNRSALLRVLSHAPRLPGETNFHNIEQLEPGQSIRFGRNFTQRRLYWNPSCAPVRRRDPREYVSGVRHILGTAVAERVGGETHVGTHLSAGLDSSTVTMLAAEYLSRAGRVSAFTAIPSSSVGHSDTRLNDEGDLAAQIANSRPNVYHRRVAPSRHALTELDKAYDLFQQPMPNPVNYGWCASINDAAAAAGIRVLLIGQSGNLTFSAEEPEVLRLLARSGRWASLFSEASAACVGGAGLGPPLKSLARMIIDQAPEAWRRHLGSGAGHGPSFIAPSAVNELPEVSQTRLRGPEKRLAMLRRLDFGPVMKGYSAGWNLEVTDPTADRRLVEFCLTIPPEEFTKAGRPRALGRRLAEGLLPRSVMSERRRGLQAADWLEQLQARSDQLTAMIARIATTPAVTELLATKRMAEAAHHLSTTKTPSGADQVYRSALFRALSVGYFVHRVENP